MDRESTVKKEYKDEMYGPTFVLEVQKLNFEFINIDQKSSMRRQIELHSVVQGTPSSRF
ncbi:hypothetical protein [Bdellovibrio bacteriovorus]|uniref:hypothetical protein n=1 Tax=Bdellovibrio bacteriovorus TaxID=959 RepID=UPI0035A6E5C5